jgi:uncharacterized protein
VSGAAGIPTVPGGEEVNVTTYAWRRLDLEGVNFVRLEEGDDAVRVEGHEICVDGAERWAARFRIELDARWEHRSTVVEVTAAAGTRELRLDGLAGHDVLDLAGNPFTNALVLRTRDVPVGGGIEVVAAYVETPGLTVRPVAQRYRRLAADRWEYADDEYGASVFTVDADRVVVDYEGLATRLG